MATRVRIFLNLLLVLALVIGQTAAVEHALSHVSDRSSHGTSGKHLPTHPACEKCLSFAKLGHGASAATCDLQLHLLDYSYTPSLPNSPALLAADSVFFARAPPLAVLVA